MAAIFAFILASVASAQGFADGSIVKAFVRPGGSNDVESTSNTVAGATGTLLVEKQGDTQRFVVQAKKIPLPAEGLAVFLGSSPAATNGAFFVNVLSGAGTNNQWNLVLEAKNGPPPFLGVDDVNELPGMFVFIVDQSTNVFLSTMITPLVPKPGKLSYHARSKLTPPNPAPSPKATGVIRVKYNGNKGASVLEIRGRNLAAGNSYCVIYTALPEPTDLSCDGGDNLTHGKGSVQHDTGKGEDLPFGVDYGVTTVADLAGLNVFVIDAFGAIHLTGTIPGPSK